MYLPKLLTKVQTTFAPDKSYCFDIRFPKNDLEESYNGSGKDGPGDDPCPFQSWFPALKVDVPVGWFVASNTFRYYMIEVPVPTAVKFQTINITFAADKYKVLESWLERWFERMVNGGKHIGTLSEIARPLLVTKTYSNPQEAPKGKDGKNATESDISKGFNQTRYYVVPNGPVTDSLEYASRAKTYTVDFFIVGKFSDKRILYTPEKTI